MVSVGSRGDSYDNALAESVIGLYKTELIFDGGPWRTVEDVELATLAWSTGGTRPGFTQRWATSLRTSSRPPTTLGSSRPWRPLSTNSSLRETRGGSRLEDERLERATRETGVPGQRVRRVGAEQHQALPSHQILVRARPAIRWPPSVRYRRPAWRSSSSCGSSQGCADVVLVKQRNTVHFHTRQGRYERALDLTARRRPPRDLLLTAGSLQQRSETHVPQHRRSSTKQRPRRDQRLPPLGSPPSGGSYSARYAWQGFQTASGGRSPRR